MSFGPSHRRIALLLLALSSAGLWAQTMDVPRDAVAAGQAVPPQLKPFDTKHLADRPYSGLLPKPQYPSTARVQREFVEEYIYDYAISRYTPEVPLPIVARSQAKRDTPENTVNAFFSAMQTGDYDAWLACWDAAAQADFAKDATELKHDAAYWKKLWAGVFAPGAKVVLTDRVETQMYVIVETRIPGTPPSAYPVALHLEKGEWRVSNDLQANTMYTAFSPALAGQLNAVPPLPFNGLPKDSEIYTAQQDFLTQHNQRNIIIRAGH